MVAGFKLAGVRRPYRGHLYRHQPHFRHHLRAWWRMHCRPAARILFSRSIVIGPLNGRSTLMLRVGNLRAQSMVEAEFRIMFTRDEPILEGDNFRHFYDLKLHFDRLIAFPAALTLRHTIDEKSPLYGETVESLAASRALFIASVVGIDPVIPAAVQTQ